MPVEEALRLHRLIIDYDLPRKLTNDQRNSHTCVWCPQDLTAGVPSVLLGETGALHPHGCLPCYEAHRDWLTVFYNWIDHTSLHTECGLVEKCFSADRFRDRLLDLHARTSKPALCCGVCNGPVSTRESLQPEILHGETLDALIIRHAPQHMVECTIQALERGPLAPIPAVRPAGSVDGDETFFGGLMVFLCTPPPFMWGCLTCTVLVDGMVGVALASTQPRADSTGCVSHQHVIAQHLATAHPEHLPAPAPGCTRCSRLPADLDLVDQEHLARHLFLPSHLV